MFEQDADPLQPDSGVARWIEPIYQTVTRTFTLITAVASLGVLLGDAYQDYRSTGYLAAENLLFVTAILGCALVVVSVRRVDRLPREAGPTRWQPVAYGVFSTLVLILTTMIYHEHFIPIETGIGIGIGIGIGLLSFQIISRTPPGSVVTPASPTRLYAFYAMFGTLLNISMILRWLNPGSAALTWLVSPVIMFIVPGLALGVPLLPENTSWIERLIFAPPLSLAAQLIALMWLIQLGIPVTLTAFFLMPVLITLVGFVAVWWRFNRPLTRKE